MNKFKKVFSYSYKNYYLPRLLSFKHRDILARNLELKSKYSGKRCFLIGGGPSVKEMDLSQFKNEYTFVMGEFDNNPQFSALNPKFYVIGDSVYFAEGESDYWNKQFEKKDKSINPDTTIIVSIDAKNYIEKHDLFKNNKFYYIGTRGIISPNLPFNINLDKYLPYPKNSMLLCMMIAVYMGFEEIYLLGCEHNFLSFNIGQGQGKSISYDYAHKDEVTEADMKNDEVVKKLAVPRDLTMTYEDNIGHVYQLFKNYRLFYNKLRRSSLNTKIFNATPGSYLDVFPMVNFSDIKF